MISIYVGKWVVKRFPQFVGGILSLSLSCLPLLFVCYHSAPLTLQEDPLESRRRREQTVSVSGAAAAASSFLNCDITLSLFEGFFPRELLSFPTPLSEAATAAAIYEQLRDVAGAR